MTITNHVRRIETLSAIVMEYVDAREYRRAHGALDEIAIRVRRAHEHIDHLQEHVPRDLVPTGGT